MRFQFGAREWLHSSNNSPGKSHSAKLGRSGIVVLRKKDAARSISATRPLGVGRDQFALNKFRQCVQEARSGPAFVCFAIAFPRQVDDGHGLLAMGKPKQKIVAIFAFCDCPGACPVRIEQMGFAEFYSQLLFEIQSKPRLFQAKAPPGFKPLNLLQFIDKAAR